MRDDTSCANDCPVANLHALKNEGSRANEDVLADSHRRSHCLRCIAPLPGACVVKVRVPDPDIRAQERTRAYDYLRSSTNGDSAHAHVVAYIDDRSRE